MECPEVPGALSPVWVSLWIAPSDFTGEHRISAKQFVDATVGEMAERTIVGQAKSISLAKFFDADGSLIGDHKWFLAVFRLRVRYWYVVLGQEAGILKS